MTNIEKNLRNILFKVGMYEDFFSALLGGFVVFVVSFSFLSFLKTRQYKNIITDEAASTINEDLVKKENSGFPKKYIVKQGDYLAKIALENYGSSDVWNKIAEENDLIYVDYLNVGQDIILPLIDHEKVLAVINDDSTISEVLSAKNTESFTGDKYVVVEGDSLFMISQKAYGVGERWVEIAEANKLWNPDLLEVGMELKIQR